MSASLALVEAPREPEDDRQLIAPGEYVAAYVRHQAVSMRMFRGSFKVYTWFRIVDPGPAFGVELYRAYRVKSLTPFRLARQSDLYYTLCKLTASRLRPDRISLKELLRNRLFRVKVRTVTTDYKGRDLPECLQYSVIDDVLSIEVAAASSDL